MTDSKQKPIAHWLAGVAAKHRPAFDVTAVGDTIIKIGDVVIGVQLRDDVDEQQACQFLDWVVAGIPRFDVRRVVPILWSKACLCPSPTEYFSRPFGRDTRLVMAIDSEFVVVPVRRNLPEINVRGIGPEGVEEWAFANLREMAHCVEWDDMAAASSPVIQIKHPSPIGGAFGLCDVVHERFGRHFGYPFLIAMPTRFHTLATSFDRHDHISALAKMIDSHVPRVTTEVFEVHMDGIVLTGDSDGEAAESA